MACCCIRIFNAERKLTISRSAALLQGQFLLFWRQREHLPSWYCFKQYYRAPASRHHAFTYKLRFLRPLWDSVNKMIGQKRLNICAEASVVLKSSITALSLSVVRLALLNNNRGGCKSVMANLVWCAASLRVSRAFPIGCRARRSHGVITGTDSFNTSRSGQAILFSGRWSV